MGKKQNHVITIIIVVCVAVLLASGISFAQTADPCLAQKAKQDERAYQSCIALSIRQKIFQSPYVVVVHAIKASGHGFGTGVIGRINGTEYVMTNNHVVEGAGEIFLQFSYGDDEIYPASIVGRDPAADLALLSTPILPHGIGSVTFGGKPQIGEEVYALGYPYGIRSLTVGFIDALQTHSWLYFLMQAPINPGNSGGPLFNARHELIGFNTVIIPGATMGFTISIEYAQQILSRLTRERLVEHGAAGFSFADTWRILPPFFVKNSLSFPPAERGVIVAEVDPMSSAAESGIRVGDMIIGINGIAVKNSEEFDKNIFFDHRPDEEVTLTTKRGAQVFERRIKLTAYVSPFANAK